MKYFNYSFQVLFKGEGNLGKRMNSTLRVKLGVQSEDGYQPSMVEDAMYKKIFGDKFSIDYARSGKDWEKYFTVSEEMKDGVIEVSITKKVQFPVVFTIEGETNEKSSDCP